MSKKTTPKPVPARSTTIKDLALLFSAPVGIFLFVLGLAYVPRLMANPQYDFVYVMCRGYDCGSEMLFAVDVGGRLRQQSQPRDGGVYEPTSRASLYRYDIERGASKPLSLDEAATLTLDSSSRSPDGYRLDRGERETSSWLFWSTRSEHGWRLEKGIARQPVDITESDYYYDERNIKRIGWVVDDK